MTKGTCQGMNRDTTCLPTGHSSSELKAEAKEEPRAFPGDFPIFSSGRLGGKRGKPPDYIAAPLPPPSPRAMRAENVFFGSSWRVGILLNAAGLRFTSFEARRSKVKFLAGLGRA